MLLSDIAIAISVIAIAGWVYMFYKFKSLKQSGQESEKDSESTMKAALEEYNRFLSQIKRNLDLLNTRVGIKLEVKPLNLEVVNRIGNPPDHEAEKQEQK
jgi:flagellar basal body-associated protein FliL